MSTPVTNDFAKAFGKGDQTVRRQCLLPQKDNQVLQVSLANLRHNFFGQIVGNIDAADDCANGRGQRLDADMTKPLQHGLFQARANFTIDLVDHFSVVRGAVVTLCMHEVVNTDSLV